MHAPRALALAMLLVPTVAIAQTRVTPATAARSIPVRSIPARAIAARSLPAVMVLDMKGDGAELDGTARTSLLTGGPVAARWTKAGTDDAFLMVDATSLRTAGISLANASGEGLEGMQLFRDGLRLKEPSESSYRVIADGWQMIAALDSNKDGKIDASDPAWGSLGLFVDGNADGTIQPGEVTGVAQAKLEKLDSSTMSRMPTTP